jgi:hypothetical protein
MSMPDVITIPPPPRPMPPPPKPFVRASSGRRIIKWTMISCGGLLAVLSCLPFRVAPRRPTEVTAKTAVVRPDPEAAYSRLRAREASGVSMAGFLRLKSGMTYNEATLVLGSDGEEISRSDLGGTTTIMYAWKNLGGLQNMNAMFQDDKLVTKAQYGLR